MAAETEESEDEGEEVVDESFVWVSEALAEESVLELSSVSEDEETTFFFDFIVFWDFLDDLCFGS